MPLFPWSLAYDPAQVAALFSFIAQHYRLDCNVHVQSPVLSGESGGSIDLSDSLVGWTIDASISDACIGAEFVFALNSGDQSLSPLVTAGILMPGGAVERPPLLPNHSINLSVNILEPDGPDALATFDDIFFGRIDRVNIAAGPGLISVKCRDLGAYFLNTFVTEARMYGSDAGVQLETVMRQLLEDNGWFASQLGVPVSPLYDIFASPFGELSLLEILRILAQQIGWDVRWFPQDPTPLRLYGPDRAVPFPEGAELVFNKNQYDAIPALEFGDEDVRNSWDGYYLDVDGVLQGPRHVEDADSIALYGLRPARIFINRAENIRTEAAMDNFLAAALADTKDPLITHSVSMPLFPPVLLNDIYKFEANGVEYDTDFIGAVSGYRHEWRAAQATGSGVARTTINLSRNRKAAFREYRRSVAPKYIVTTVDTLPTAYAPEGTVVYPVGSLTPP